ncbi:MAG: SDR family oxidoreductase [Alphaproteobacteria bacterium]
MHLIVGASGAVGVPTIKHLVAKGERVRALTSSDQSAARLKSLGVTETIVGDFRRNEDVARAVAGMKSVLHIPPRFTEDEGAISRRVIDAARAARVEHFCFCSAYHSPMRALGHHWQKLETEEYLIDSDLLYTVVQPSMFMQNIRVEWAKVAGEGIYARPYSPDSLMSVIDTDNLGEAFANILTQRRLQGATYELNGPGPITHNQMAAIISEELGRPVKAVKRDLSEWEGWARARGWADYSIKTYVAMCKHYNDHGYKYGNEVQLTAILGRAPNDYRTFIRRFVAEQAKAN